MKRPIRLAAAAAIAGLACATTAADAGALSLGPAGTTIDAGATGFLGQPESTYPGLQFGPAPGQGANIGCDVKMSGRLDGGPSVLLATTFANCKAVYTSLPNPVVTAPGGLRLTMTTFSGSSGHGQLVVGAGGLKVTSGACTLTVASGTRLADGAYLTIGKGTFSVNPNNRLSNAYTGTTGCPTTLRGTHTTGAVVGLWGQYLPGLAPAA